MKSKSNLILLPTIVINEEEEDQAHGSVRHQDKADQELIQLKSKAKAEAKAYLTNMNKGLNYIHHR